MKSMSPHRHLSGSIAALFVTAATHAAFASVTVDGTRDVGDGYDFLANQATVSNWNAAGVSNNEHEALANIHAVQDGSDLAIHLAARVKDRAIILFVDSKAGGRSFIPNNLITFGGEESFINNLGTNGSSGMTFESGFEPDYAIRIYGDGGTGAFVNTYDFLAGTRVFAGNAGVADVTSGVISIMRAFNLGAGTINNTTGDYAAAVNGVEMKLNLAALGVQPGVQTVRLMAVLVTNDSTYGSNQVLASRTSTDDIAGAINSIEFGALSEPGLQTLSVPVTGPDSRNVVFNVNMSAEITKGYFNPATDKVKVLFFSGSASPIPGEIYLTDGDADQIYTGTVVAVGTEGASFGNYKYFNTAVGAPNFGFEYGFDRSFNLGALNTTETRNETFTGNSFALWSSQFSDGQSVNQDRDGDGVPNGIEYFMGSNNSSFTPNPQIVSDLITWPRDRFATGVSFKVWRSDNLSTWQDVTLDADITDQNSVKYMVVVAPGAPKRFVRLEVSVP
jgi:hypothetical protein